MNDFPLSESEAGVRANPTLAEMFRNISEAAFSRAQGAFASLLGRSSDDDDDRASERVPVKPITDMPSPDQKGSLTMSKALTQDIIRIDENAREAAADRFHERSHGRYRGRANDIDDRGL